MSTPVNVTTRYSDDELKEFKDIIDNKLAKASEQYASLKEQLKDITENNNDDFAKDITDFSSIQSELEMLNNMANHQRKYIQDLENALIRINNKSYGICVVTGELIEKKRLLAVPTTTKSVVAKTQSEMKDVQVPKDRARGFDEIDEPQEDKPAKKAEPRRPVIITKVIKKSSANPAAAKSAGKEEDDIEFDREFNDIDFDYDKEEDDIAESDDIHFDTFSDEDKMSDDY